MAAYPGRRRQAWQAPASGFVALPNDVLRSPQLVALGVHATRLLVDLLAQYNGRNNGDMSASWTAMKRRNWRSRQTLRKALVELEEGSWIVRTRQGGRHRATKYGLTVYNYDPRPDHDILPKDFPKGAWWKVKPVVKPKRIRRHAPRATDPAISTKPDQIPA